MEAKYEIGDIVYYNRPDYNQPWFVYKVYQVNPTARRNRGRYFYHIIPIANVLDSEDAKIRNYTSVWGDNLSLAEI